MDFDQPTLNSPPRDAASIVLVRDSAAGLQVLLMRRHTDDKVLGGAYVFPGGKLEWDDSSPAMFARLDDTPQNLHRALGEPALPVDVAAGLFVAALREAFEESNVLFATHEGRAVEPKEHQEATNAARAGTAFSALLAQHDWRLNTQMLVPWSRWVTPRRPAMMNRRFDTRFFLAGLPDRQVVQGDDFEVTDTRWLTPRQALEQYRTHQIDLAPPQIVSLMHLLAYRNVADAMAEARTRPPPLVEPEPVEHAGERGMCYPGDPAYSKTGDSLPTTTRLVWRDKRFVPPEGFEHWLA